MKVYPLIKYTLFSLMILSLTTISGQNVQLKDSIKRLSINTDAEEILPLLGNDGTLYFVRTFYEENIGGESGGQDIWYATSTSGKWNTPINLQSLNNAYNNAVVGIGEKNQLYLLNSYSNPLRWSDFGVSSSRKAGARWDRPEELSLSFNLPGDLRGYYISPKEDVIVVSAEKADSYGLEDLYIYYKENGEWKAPVHLNEKINTDQAEISPFISPDHQVLFFASEGHDGKGNFDIYTSERIDDSWENWTAAKNLESINSEAFEGYFSTYENGLSFFASGRENNSTDIYGTTISIDLKGIENDMLAHDEVVRKSFRDAMLLDTLLHNRATEVTALTAETPHAIYNILKGNDIFNRRLLGVEERDSLINLYSEEQGEFSRSSVEYQKRNLWNRALSEDIRTAVDRNAIVADKLTRVPIDSVFAEDDEYQQTIGRLKSEISELLVANAVLKQETSELVASNAAKKHFIAVYDGETSTTESEIVSQNKLIDEKVADWVSGLKALRRKIDELMSITSEQQAFLTSTTKEKILTVPSLEKLGVTLELDTRAINQIVLLEKVQPSIFKGAAQLLSNTSEINKNLQKMQEGDSVLSQQVVDISGLDRNSTEYKELHTSIQEVTEDIVKASGSNDELITDARAIAEANTDTLTSSLTSEIVNELELKQSLSDLLLKNALLKKDLVQTTDGGSGTSDDIQANANVIQEKISELEEAVETVESATLEIEKEVSPERYIQHILDKYSTVHLQFSLALLTDNNLTGSMEELLAQNSQKDEKVAALTIKNRVLNDTIFDVNEGNLSLTDNILKYLNTAQADTDLKILKKENLKVGAVLESKVSRTRDLSDDLIKATGGMEPASFAMYSAFERDVIVTLIGENGQLKGAISDLYASNASLKQDLLQPVLFDTATSGQLRATYASIEEKIEEWQKNMESLGDLIEDMKERVILQERIDKLLATYAPLKLQIEETIQKDSLTAAYLSPLAKEIGGSFPDLLSKNGQLRRDLGFINEQYHLLNQEFLGNNQANLGNTVAIATSIEQRNDNSDALMKSFPADADEEIPVLLTQTAKSKNGISLLLNQDASLRLYLDGIALDQPNDLALEAIESNNTDIGELLSDWEEALEALNKIVLPTEVDSMRVEQDTIPEIALEEMLTNSESSRSKFRDAMLLDTLLHSRTFEITALTAETPHAIYNVLKGNSIFNRRLLGIEERDSLINLYSFEQGELPRSSDEYKKRSLWNRALSEDIGTAVDRNAIVADKLTRVLIDTAFAGNDEYQQTIGRLKSEISELLVANAVLKQAASELVASNAAKKHFVTVYDGETSMTKWEIISQNNAIEEKVADWMLGLEALRRKIDELMSITSERQAFLSGTTKEKVLTVPSLEKLGVMLDLDTRVINQIVLLEKVQPSLFKGVDQLLSNTSEINKGLREMQEGDSVLSQQVVDISGLDRSSQEFKERYTTIQEIAAGIVKNSESNDKLIAESLDIVEANTDSLTAPLTKEIVTKLELKQSLSDLLLKNALLKKDLVQTTDGGDATSDDIQANANVIQEKVSELEEAVETVENATLEIEKEVSPKRYIQHILDKYSTVHLQFNLALLTDNNLTGSMEELLAESSQQDEEVAALTTKNRVLNDTIFDVNEGNQSLTDNIEKYLKEELTDSKLAKLVKENLETGAVLESKAAKTKELSDDLVQATEGIEPKSFVLYSAFERDVITTLIGDNTQLKGEISDLFESNGSQKQDLLQPTLFDTAVSSQVRASYEQVRVKIEEWQKNMESLGELVENMQKRFSIQKSVNQLLSGYTPLKLQLEETIQKDFLTMQYLSPLTEGKAGVLTDFLTKNNQLRRDVAFINEQYHLLNKDFLADSQAETSSGVNAIATATSIEQRSNSSDDLMQSFPEDVSEETLVLLKQAAKSKNGISLLLNQDASLQLYLDKIALDQPNDLALEAIASNNADIGELLTDWQEALEALNKTTIAVDMDSIQLVSGEGLETGQEVSGYTVQLIAMSHGIMPNDSFMSKFGDVIKMSMGKDGLDRYYIGRYDTKKEALKVMRSFRKKGYSDVFVRAILKYSSL